MKRAVYLQQLALAVAVLVLFGSCHRKSGTQTNQALLDGTWQVVSMGHQDPDETHVLIRWEFREGRISVFCDNDTQPVSSSPYRIDDGKSPSRIVMEIEDVEKESRHGIYSLEGDRLRIRFTVGGGAAPEEFSPDDDLVFKKVSGQEAH